MAENIVLHAGPPIPWEKMCGPQYRGIINALIYEGLADTEKSAKTLVDAGEVRIAPCHDYGAVGGMAGITSASTPMAVVRDKAGGKEGYSQLFQGPRGQLQSRDDYDKAALEQWRWIETVLGPVLQAAIRERGGLDVRNLTAKALQMGDECHNRNSAGSALILLDMMPYMIKSCPETRALSESIEYLSRAEQFSLCISMAAAKVTADAARGVPYSTIVTAMSRNGVEFGIKQADWMINGSQRRPTRSMACISLPSGAIKTPCLTSVTAPSWRRWVWVVMYRRQPRRCNSLLAAQWPGRLTSLRRCAGSRPALSMPTGSRTWTLPRRPLAPTYEKSCKQVLRLSSILQLHTKKAASSAPARPGARWIASTRP